MVLVPSLLPWIPKVGKEKSLWEKIYGHNSSCKKTREILCIVTALLCANTLTVLYSILIYSYFPKLTAVQPSFFEEGNENTNSGKRSNFDWKTTRLHILKTSLIKNFFWYSGFYHWSFKISLNCYQDVLHF